MENDDKLYLTMENSYVSLTDNFKKTIKEFIIFNGDGDIISITETDEKITFLDDMIKYYEKHEAFEKCAKLLKLKNVIIKK